MLFSSLHFSPGGAKTVRRGDITHLNPAYQQDSKSITPAPSNTKIELTSTDLKPDLDINSNDLKTDLKLTSDKPRFFIDPDIEAGHVNPAYEDHDDQNVRSSLTSNDPSDLDPRKDGIAKQTTAQPQRDDSCSGSSFSSSDLDIESATVSQLGSDLNLTSKDPRPEVDQSSILSHASTLNVNLDTDSIVLEGSFVTEDTMAAEKHSVTSNLSEPLSPELAKWDELFELSYSESGDTPTRSLTPNTLTPTGSLTPDNMTPTGSMTPDNATPTESVTPENATPRESLNADTDITPQNPDNIEDTPSLPIPKAVTFIGSEGAEYTSAPGGKKIDLTDPVTFDLSRPVTSADSISGVPSIGNHNALQHTF